MANRIPPCSLAKGYTPAPEAINHSVCRIDITPYTLYLPASIQPYLVPQKSNNRKTARSLTRQVQRPTLNSALGQRVFKLSLWVCVDVILRVMRWRQPWGWCGSVILGECVNGILGCALALSFGWCVDAILRDDVLTLSVGVCVDVILWVVRWRYPLGGAVALSFGVCGGAILGVR